jgi:hypothetical protein
MNFSSLKKDGCVGFILVAILFLLFPADINGQSTLRNPNMIYVEVGGHSVDYAVNYERIFNSGGKFQKSWRVGAGISGDAISLPFALQFVRSIGPRNSKSPHNLVLDVGPTIYVDQYKGFSGNQSADESDTYVYLVGGFGYRYSDGNQKLFFQLALNPYFIMDITRTELGANSDLQVAGSAAVGIRF